MKKQLLVADDDKTFQRIIARAFEETDWKVMSAEDGVSAMEQISARAPDVILLDLNMPRLGGRELLARLRRDPRFSMIPIIIISGDGSPQEQADGFGLGADDFVSKPFSLVELAARVESVLRRARSLLAANPLTLLPGGPAIEEEAGARIKTGEPMAFFYIDIDNFKAYNDNYGYLNGDNAIKRTAGVLTLVRGALPEAGLFVGHIGGDDFALMCAPRWADRVAAEVASRFDALAPGFYNREDSASGFTVAKDRAGNTRNIPLMSLTIAAVTNEKRDLYHYARITDIVSEIKKYLKGRPGQAGSAYLKDRRMD